MKTQDESIELIFESQVELPSFIEIVRIARAVREGLANVFISLEFTDHAYLDIKVVKTSPTPLNLRN